MNSNSIPPKEDFVKDKIELTRLDRQHIYRLISLRNYYSRRGELQADGSFFHPAKKLYGWLKCKQVSLMRSRKRIIATGEIKYKAGGGRGNASYYWILDDPEKPKEAPRRKFYERPVLYPARAKELERRFGRQDALTRLVEEGYREEEIIKALGEPVHGEDLDKRESKKGGR